MSDRDEFRIDELRDDLDDRLLGDMDRAELLGLIPSRTAPTGIDPWEPNPRDLEPEERVYTRYGREGT